MRRRPPAAMRLSGDESLCESGRCREDPGNPGVGGISAGLRGGGKSLRIRACTGLARGFTGRFRGAETAVDPGGFAGSDRPSEQSEQAGPCRVQAPPLPPTVTGFAAVGLALDRDAPIRGAGHGGNALPGLAPAGCREDDCGTSPETSSERPGSGHVRREGSGRPFVGRKTFGSPSAEGLQGVGRLSGMEPVAPSLIAALSYDSTL